MASIEVIEAVRKLSLNGRTVVCTIHQPSVTVFSNFDNLYLMAYGRTIYNGPVKDAVTFFTLSPYRFRYDVSVNPADFVVAVAGAFINAADGSKVSGDQLADYWDDQAQNLDRETEYRQSTATPAKVDLKTSPTVALQSLYPTPPIYQIQVLLHRYFLKFFRQTKVINVSMAR